MITEKELERQNFIIWYSMYATAEDIQKGKRINKSAVERLIREYSQEIESIDTGRNLH